jgi:hypothetical protein
VATKTPRAKTSLHTIDELEEQATIDEQMLEPGTWEAKWKAECEKEQATFWDKIALVPKHAQHELLVYLYRLEPRVYNKQGDPSYQAKYSLPITLEQVQEDFGGGRYEIYLKRGRRTIAGKYIFSVSGQPKYKEGQTDATGKPVAGAASAPSESRGGSELAEALKALVPLLKNDNGSARAAEASVDVMKTGMNAALEMQRDAAGAPNEIMKTLIERALAPAQAPDALALLEKIITISSKLQPQPVQNPSSLDSLDSQMGLVEKLTGKSFSELLTPAGHAPKVDPWAAMVGALVSVAPGLLREFRQMQYERMQWHAHLASRGIVLNPPGPQLVPPPPPNNQPNPAEVPPPPNPAQPAEPADQAAQQATQEQVITGVVNDIVKYFRGGWDGYACASAIAVNYAEYLPYLAPVLSDRAQVDAFIAQTPALAALAAEPADPERENWTDFVDVFFWTLNPDQAPADDDAVDPDPRPPKPRSRKQKAAVAEPVH